MSCIVGLLAEVLIAVPVQAKSASDMNAVVERASRYLRANLLADEGGEGIQTTSGAASRCGQPSVWRLRRALIWFSSWWQQLMR